MITWDRRDFLLMMGQAMLAPLLPWSCAKNANDFPELAGAKCQRPTNHEEETLLMLTDTIVPGAKEDPRRLPGALEACPLELLYDPNLPVVAAAPLIVSLLDNTAKSKFGSEYKALSLADRTTVTADVESRSALLSYLMKFIRSIYFTSPIAYDAIGYPGQNLGYIHHPSFSVREPLGEGMTEDGNLP